MTHVIAILPIGFNPDLIEILVGDRVAFRNEDTIAHRIAETKHSGYKVELDPVFPGMLSVEIEFNDPTLFAYRSESRPYFRGAVNVVKEPRADDTVVLPV